MTRAVASIVQLVNWQRVTIAAALTSQFAHVLARSATARYFRWNVGAGRSRVAHNRMPVDLALLSTQCASF